MDDATALAKLRHGLAAELEYWPAYADWAADGSPSQRLCDMLAWCGDRAPSETPSVLLWGDARLGNALYDERAHRLNVLLDWELASVGPREMDVAWYLMMEELTEHFTGVAPPGFASRDDVVAAYSQHANHDVSDIGWHMIFALTRSVTLSDRHARVAERTGEFFPGVYGDNNPLLQYAEMLIERQKG